MFGQKDEAQVKAEKAAETKRKRAYKSLKTVIKKQAESGGLRALEMRLEFLKLKPNTPLDNEFSYEENIEAYQDVIEDYKEALRKAEADNFEMKQTKIE